MQEVKRRQNESLMFSPLTQICMLLLCSGKTTPGGKKKKKMAKGGEVSVSQKRKKKSSKNPKALARACGMVMEGRRKRTKYS